MMHYKYKVNNTNNQTQFNFSYDIYFNTLITMDNQA